VHLLFICRSEKEKLEDILTALGSLPVLSVTDFGGARGPAIALALENGHVIFDVDATAARRAGLHISSKLLHVAHSVQ
jgi:YfiR/HmsC-like